MHAPDDHPRYIEVLREWSPRLTRTAYMATTFVSALLLFAVQPMLTKMVLPTLGGSPSVWAVSMCVFQGALLLGYCYAFVLNQRASMMGALVVHVGLLAIACTALPVALPNNAASLSAGGSYLWLVVVLAMAAGLPFLAVAANAPLLQAWFARSGDRNAHDPYFLYRASNAGSLAALLAYPVVVEPLCPLSAQATMWSFGFVLLGLMIGLCGTLVLANLPKAVPANLEGARGDRGAPVEWQQRLAWMGLAFVPSGLLVAFTTFLTTDVAAAPFLWVAPLAIYLVTFIVVFRPSQPGQRWLELAQPVVVAVAIINQSELGRVHLLVDSGVGLVAFVVTCLVCHRRLYLRRPSAVQVTEFYLWMSLGGVLGGIFSAIVAPQIFSSPIEYPLLLALGLAWVLPSLMGRIGRIELAAIGISVVLGLALGFALASRWGGDPNSWGQSIRMWLVLAVAAAAITAVILPRLQIVLVALAALLVTAALGQSSDYTARSFFGVHRVVEHGPFRLLYHGTTLHGAQAIRTPDGQPIPWNEPPPAITYFHPLSTHALGLKLMRDAFQEKNRPPAVGIIGLGAGAMACHARRGENWKFFEIDPLVVKIAKNERLFNYLSNCAKDAEIVLGDARVTLAKQESGTFDYLLFDAFTSDAVPVHLLTVEAIQLYLEKLSPRGVLALHVSNLHLDLVPVVAANVNAIPGLSAVYVKNFGRNDYTALPTSVVLIARQAGVVLPVTQLLRPDPKMIIDVRHLASVGVAPWTDDFSNVASALIRNYRNARKSADDRDIEYFSAVIARFPEAAIPYGRRGVAYFAKRLYGAAIDDLTAMMSIGGPVPEAYKIRGAAHQFSGNDVAAIADLTAYLSKQHNDVVALRLRGIAYGNLGQRDKAIADLRRVLFLNPTNQQAQQLLGRLGGSQ